MPSIIINDFVSTIIVTPLSSNTLSPSSIWSANSMPYAKPEQPVVVTFTLMPTPEMLDSGAMTPMKYNKMAYKNLVMSGDNFFEYKKQISLGNINSLSEVLNFKFTEMPSTKCLGDYIEEYDWLEELHANRFDEDGNEKENARDDAHYPAQYHTMVSKIIMSKLKEDK